MFLFRYAFTNILMEIKNNDATSIQEANFDMLIPKDAFVSDFSMKVKNKVFKGKVKERTDAEKSFESASENAAIVGLKDSIFDQFHEVNMQILNSLQNVTIEYHPREMTAELRRCIFDPMLGKPICIREVVYDLKYCKQTAENCKQIVKN